MLRDYSVSNLFTNAPREGGGDWARESENRCINGLVMSRDWAKSRLRSAGVSGSVCM